MSDKFDNLNDDFDFDDLDSMIDEDSSGDRKPAGRFLTKAKTGFIDDFKDTPASETVRRGIKDALPGVLGKDTAHKLDSSVSSFRKTLTDNARQLKTQARPILNRVDKSLPESGISRSIFNKLNKMVGTSKQEQQRSIEQERQEEINNLLAQSIKGNDKDKHKELLDQYIDFSMKMSTEEKLASISSYAQIQQEFNDKVTTEFYRKSLELQYKQLYVSRDTKNILRLGFDTLTKLSDSIVKNTGLPDFVKLRSSEALAQRWRQQVVGKVEKKLFTNNEGLQRALGAVQNNVARYSSNVLGMLTATNDANDMADTTDEMGISKGEMAGMFGAGFVKEKLANLFGREIRSTKAGRQASDKMSDLMMDPSAYFGKAAENSSNRIGKNVYSFLSRLTSAGDNGFGSGALEIDNPDDAVVFDGRTRTSITKIIPGILSKILKEVTSIRTGKSADELKYDFARDEFVTSGSFKRDFVRDLRRNFKDDGVDKNIVRFIKDLGTKTGTELSREETLSMSKALYDYSLTGSPMGPEYLERFGFYDSMQPQFAIKLKMMFKRFTETESGNRDLASKAKLTSALTSIKASLRDPKTKISDLIESGRTDELRELGIIKFDPKTKKNVINIERYNELNKAAGMQAISGEFTKINGYGESSFTDDEEKGYIKTALKKLGEIKIGEVVDSVTGKTIEITSKIKNKYNGSFIQKYLGKGEKAFRKEVGLKLHIPYTSKKKFYAILEERAKNSKTAREINSFIEKHTPTEEKSFVASLYNDAHVNERVSDFRKRISSEFKLHKNQTVKEAASDAYSSVKESTKEGLSFAQEKSKGIVNKVIDLNKETADLREELRNQGVDKKEIEKAVKTFRTKTRDAVKSATSPEKLQSTVDGIREDVMSKVKVVSNYLSDKYNGSKESRLFGNIGKGVKKKYNSMTEMLADKFNELVTVTKTSVEEQKKENSFREEDRKQEEKATKISSRNSDEFARFNLFGKKGTTGDKELDKEIKKEKKSGGLLSMLPGLLTGVLAAPFKLIGAMSSVLTNTLGGVLTAGKAISGAGMLLGGIGKSIKFGSKLLWGAIKMLPGVIGGLSALSRFVVGNTLGRVGGKIASKLKIPSFLKRNKKLLAIAGLAAAVTPTMLEGSDEVSNDFDNMNTSLDSFMNGEPESDVEYANMFKEEESTDGDSIAMNAAMLGGVVGAEVAVDKIANSNMGRRVKKSFSKKAMEAKQKLGLKPLSPVKKDIASKANVVKTYEKMGDKALVIKDADAARKLKSGAVEVRKLLPKGGFKWVKLAKGIPVAGLILAGGFAASRIMDGDLVGAGLELLSGAASTVPFFGTALFVAIEGYIMYRDATRTEKPVIDEDGSPLMSWEWLTKSISWVGEKASNAGAAVAESVKETYNETTNYWGGVYDDLAGNDKVPAKQTVTQVAPATAPQHGSRRRSINVTSSPIPTTGRRRGQQVTTTPVAKEAKESNTANAGTIVGASTELVKDAQDSGIFKGVVKAIAYIIRQVESRNVYNTVAVLGDGAGISFGGYQFTENSGSLLKFMKQLAALKPSYLESVNAHIAMFRGNSYGGSRHRFKTFLKQIGATPLGIKAQDMTFYEHYYKPGKQLAKNFTNPMVVLHIIDALHNGGAKSVIRRLKENSLAGIEKARLEYWQSLTSKWRRFGNGWINRLKSIKSLAEKYLTGVSGEGLDLNAIGAGAKIVGNAIMPGSSAVGGAVAGIKAAVDGIKSFFGIDSDIGGMITKGSNVTSKVMPDLDKVKSLNDMPGKASVAGNDSVPETSTENFAKNIKVQDNKPQSVKLTSDVSDFTVEAEKKKIGSLFTMESVLKKTLEKQTEMNELVKNLIEVTALVPDGLNGIGDKLDKNGKSIIKSDSKPRLKEVNLSRGQYER